MSDDVQVIRDSLGPHMTASEGQAAWEALDRLAAELLRLRERQEKNSELANAREVEEDVMPAAEEVTLTFLGSRSFKDGQRCDITCVIYRKDELIALMLDVGWGLFRVTKVKPNHLEAQVSKYRAALIDAGQHSDTFEIREWCAKTIETIEGQSLDDVLHSTAGCA